MRRTARLRRSGDERGAVLVEFAFVGPLLFLMVIGLLDFSLIIVGNTAGTNAVREGARVGIINYIDADVPTSVNHQKIATAVKRRLVGLVREDVVVSVRCVDGDEQDPHGTAEATPGSEAGTIPCSTDFVTPGADLLEVSFKWRHIGASPFVANSLHHERAMLMIQGKADYTIPSTTTTVFAPASASTTSTTLPGATTTTTTPPTCQIDAYTTSRTTTALTIYKSGSKAGQVKPSPGALGVKVTAPGCPSGSVTIRIAGGPAPYNAGVAMDFVSADKFSYSIGGSDWSTGTYTVTLRSPANTKTFPLSVYG